MKHALERIHFVAHRRMPTKRAGAAGKVGA